MNTLSTLDTLPKHSQVSEWKKFLQNKGLYSGDVNSEDADDAFKTAMVALEGSITKEVPSVAGMIWQNAAINPQASIEDVQEALKLIEDYKKPEQKRASALSDLNNTESNIQTELSAFAQATLDALGPPTADDFIGTPFKQMFVTQEASKLNSFNPTKPSQNQGAFISDVPSKPSQKHQKNTAPVVVSKEKGNLSNIDNRMDQLVNLMEIIKK